MTICIHGSMGQKGSVKADGADMGEHGAGMGLDALMIRGDARQNWNTCPATVTTLDENDIM